MTKDTLNEYLPYWWLALTTSSVTETEDRSPSLLNKNFYYK